MKERKKYCNCLKLNNVKKIIKSFLSDKGKNTNKITVVDNYKVTSDDKQLWKTFN